MITRDPVILNAYKIYWNGCESTLFVIKDLL